MKAESTPTGRRVRNMQDKRERIFNAASHLFAQHGFEAVTSQQIADAADVGSGTVFRYAASKSELLIMVYNVEFAAALARGERDASVIDEPTGAIHALMAPTVRHARANVENSAAYQRELLFGVGAEKYRAEGLALVERLQASIGAVLRGYLKRTGGTVDETAIDAASSSAFAAMHLLIARLSTGSAGADDHADLRTQIAQIVAGVVALSASTTSQQREGEVS